MLGTSDTRASSIRVRSVVLVVAIGGALYLCWLMARPFLAVISWAMALAILAYPFTARLERRMNANLAALLSILLVAAIVVTPAIFLTRALFKEVSGSLASLASELRSDRIFATFQQHALVAKVLEWAQRELDLDAQIQDAAGAVTSRISSWVSGSVWIVTQLVLTFLTLFYFLRDRTRILAFFRRFIPLAGTETDEIFDRIAQTVSASLYRNLLVKVIQGALGGVMFWILGLPSPVLCAAAMALFAILPFVGTALVWGPAAIYLAYTGSWVKAVILLGWGGLVVSLVDNFLYPMLVASELRFHPLSVFFAVLGGLIAFGVAGVVLGPVILAVTVALLEIWDLKRPSRVEV